LKELSFPGQSEKRRNINIFNVYQAQVKHGHPCLYKMTALSLVTKSFQMNVWRQIKKKKKKKTTIYDAGNAGPGLGQAQKCGGVKTVNGIPTRSLLIIGLFTFNFKKCVEI